MDAFHLQPKELNRYWHYITWVTSLDLKKEMNVTYGLVFDYSSVPILDYNFFLIRTYSWNANTDNTWSSQYDKIYKVETVK